MVLSVFPDVKPTLTAVKTLTALAVNALTPVLVHQADAQFRLNVASLTTELSVSAHRAYREIPQSSVSALSVHKMATVNLTSNVRRALVLTLALYPTPVELMPNAKPYAMRKTVPVPMASLETLILNAPRTRTTVCQIPAVPILSASLLLVDMTAGVRQDALVTPLQDVYAEVP